MKHDDEKAWYFEELATVRTKRARLAIDSPIRKALSDDVLSQVERKINDAKPVDLCAAYWPPLYGFFAIKSDDAIAALDSEIRFVIQHSRSASICGVTQFMKTKDGEQHGRWYGGLFDVWTKATAARYGEPFEFDHPLPNGRANDVLLVINGRRFHIESTVFTPDDESEEVWREFLKDFRRDQSRILVRPGPYCPPNAKGPSPYYVTRRFHAKVFDKLAKDLDPSKSQFAENEPNALLVSFSGPGMRPDKPGIGWALDELFAAQPRSSPISDSIPDISLCGWINFRANELTREHKLSAEWYCEHSHEVIAAPRRLGAILLFEGCILKASRINYNAHSACSITHREMADLEHLFAREVSYWA